MLRIGCLTRFASLILVTCWLLAGSRVSADEGMWLFNHLPKERLQERYDFDPTEEWAEHLRSSSVRFNSGGSGSFVSSDGLVLTNHHVASDTLHKLSTPDRNIITTGFLAKTPEDELKAPDLELNQLVSIEDVTERVGSAVTDSMSPEEATKARRAAMTDIETESQEATSLRSNVITLYGGAVYHLYRYKKFTDIRLVWAPETKAAFFGGDADNFEYPRYCLDAALMRVYEEGKPAKLQHFLEWSDTPVASEIWFLCRETPGGRSEFLPWRHSSFFAMSGILTCSIICAARRSCCSNTAWTARNKNGGHAMNCSEFKMPAKLTREC
jgi:hypothetical protein